MNKLVIFKHLTGSVKPIPGVKTSQIQPRLKAGFAMSPELRRPINGLPVGTFPVLENDPNFKPSLVLVDEAYQDLSDDEKTYPPAMVARLEQERAEEAIARRNANRRVMDALQRYVTQGEIEIVSIEDMPPEELVKTRFPIVSLSEIAIADHEQRNIPIPPELQGNKMDTERIRAQAKINSKKK